MPILRVVKFSDDFPDFYIDFGLKSSIWWVDLENSITGRSPRFPKKISSSRQIYRFHLLIFTFDRSEGLTIMDRNHK